VAIAKLTFTKQPRGIKASLRYYVHRPEQSTTQITREIFGRDGRISKYDAYRMIDRAGPGTTFFASSLALTNCWKIWGTVCICGT
jgi:hypothetical protein